MRDLSAGQLNTALQINAARQATVESDLAGHPIVARLAEAVSELRSVEPPKPTPALNEFLGDDRDDGRDDDE